MTETGRGAFVSSGVHDEDLVRVPKPDEAEHLPARLECDEAPDQPVRRRDGEQQGGQGRPSRDLTLPFCALQHHPEHGAAPRTLSAQELCRN